MFDSQNYRIFIEHAFPDYKHGSKEDIEYHKNLDKIFKVFTEFGLKVILNGFGSSCQRYDLCNILLKIDKDFKDVSELYRFFNKFLAKLKRSDFGNDIVNVSLYDTKQIETNLFGEM